MMNCADARPLLDPFCDGALDAGDCALVLDHLKSCQPCQSELNDLEGLRARFREARENCRMPAGLTDKISQTLKKEERAARRQFLKHGANPVFLLAMAAAVFIVGLFALPSIQQFSVGTGSSPSISAEKLIDDLPLKMEQVADRTLLPGKVGYQMKYLSLPDWRMKQAGVYQSKGAGAIARFDFSKNAPAGEEHLVCFQARQGAITARGTEQLLLHDTHVTLGHHNRFQYALWYQNERAYLLVTALPQLQLEEIVRSAAI